MYSPRRLADDSMADGRVPLGARPTRAIQEDRAGLGSALRTRSVPVAVALAMTATAGAIVVAPQMSGSNQAEAAAPQAVAAIDRDVDLVDRGESRPSVTSSPTASPKQVSMSLVPTPTKKATPKASATAKATATKKASVKKSVTGKSETTKSSTKTSTKKVRKVSSKSSETKTSTPPSKSRYKKSGSVLGLKPSAMVVYNAVMSRWGGQINSVGGYRGSSRSVHQCGRAIDFMLTPGKESALGWSIAKYLAANAGKYDVNHIIFEQKIWTPYRPYWRGMENRGSITQNHYDHVHVAVGASRC